MGNGADKSKEETLTAGGESASQRRIYCWEGIGEVHM